MKIVPPPSPPPRSANNLRLGIVRLGKAAGKIKYALLDECDISLVQQYAFEAKVVVDPNGMGAAVYAWAYDIKKGRHTGDYVHTLLWELHRGDIAPGCKVVHVNNVTVDNRLDNLALVPAGATDTPGHALCGNTSSSKGSDVVPPPARSLYWFAIAQLPVDPLEEQHYSNEVRLQQQQEQGIMGGVVRTCLNRNGEVLEVLERDVLGGLDGPLGGLLLPGGGICYYECRYPPCTQMEQHLRQFSICGRCQEARYCGTTCQQRDWPVHKKTCQPKPRPTPSYTERSPER